MKKMILFCLSLIFFTPVLALGQFATPSAGTLDSIGVDVDGGSFDNYLYPSYLREGANVTFTVAGDTLTIAGVAGSGTADSAAVDTAGDLTNIAYLYNTGGPAFFFREGENITFTVDNETLYIAGETGGLDSAEIMTVIRDTTYIDSALVAGVVRDTGAILYQPLEATLTDIADGTIDENLVNTANPWADNEIATSGNWNTAYGWGDHSAQGYVDTAELHDSCDVLRAEMPDSARDVAHDTADVLRTDIGKIADDTTNYQTAYGWGDWSTTVGKITDDTTNYQTAYGWGDHSTQNYLDNDDGNVDTAAWNAANDAKADTAGDGSNVVDLGSPFVIQEGTNITLTVDNDTVTITGAAGGSNADSIKSIPVQDTTGNIGDVFGLTFDDSKDTLVWTEFWATPQTAPTDNYVLKIDTDPDPDTFYWAADQTGAAGTADSMQVDTSGAGAYASIYATGGYAFTFREGAGIDYTANTDTVYVAATLGTDIAWAELQSAVQETIQARLPLAGGQMTGNITMAGAQTVDGKDVSTLTDIGQTVESGEITDQTIVKADIDTTSGFVFANAFKITSAEADSAYMTKGYMDGTFLTGNETITLSGDATGSGATAITVTVMDDLHNHTTTSISGLDVSDDLNLTAGDHITLTDDDLDVDDDFLLNTGDIGTGVYDFGGATSFELPNATNPTTDAKGEIAYDTDDGGIEVFDSVLNVSVLMPVQDKFEALIWAPDGITDTIPLFYVDSTLYQGGIKIVSAELQTSVDGAYALNLYEFTAADPPVFAAHIDTLNVGASDQRVQSTTFTDSDIARGAIIYINTPATDIDWIRVSIRYYVKGND